MSSEEGGGCDVVIDAENTFTYGTQSEGPWLGGFCGQDSFSDCALVLTDGTRLPAHRIILASSKVFNAILLGGFHESETCEISVDGGEPEVRCLLNYMYTGTTVIQSDTALGLYMLSEKYGFDGLKDACYRQMSSKLTTENVSKVFSILGHCILAIGCAKFIGTRDLDCITISNSFKEMPSQAIIKLVRLLKEIYSPHDEYTFRLLWRWYIEQPNERSSVWDCCIEEGLINCENLTRHTIKYKLKKILDEKRYIAVLEKVLDSVDPSPTPVVDHEGFPSDPHYRYGCLSDCPVAMLEATITRIMKWNGNAGLDFGTIISLVSSENKRFVIKPEIVWNSLHNLVERRYLDTDNGGYFQYRP